MPANSLHILLGAFLLKANVQSATTDVDWNTITGFGIYTHAGISTTEKNHSPVSGNVGVLIVFGYASNRLVQVDISGVGIAVRTCVNTWSGWSRVIFTS